MLLKEQGFEHGEALATPVDFVLNDLPDNIRHLGDDENPTTISLLLQI